MPFGILKFRETYMERIWGGDKLRRVLGKPIQSKEPVGEAWLISDHPACESLVAEGEYAGQTLRDVMIQDASGLLGTRAVPTGQGRFPLLLKLIDAGDVLSVQVHPDDEQAARFGESDSGKTEMWHVLDADPGSIMISGLQRGVTDASFRASLASGDVASLMHSFSVTAGDSIFLKAGRVHAIGSGILLAEIQQNSDITYRLFDWDRVDKNGVSRELHIEKALSVMDYSSDQIGCVTPLRYVENDVAHEVLAACPYFAAERLQICGQASFISMGNTFHIMLALDDTIALTSEEGDTVLRRGEAALIPASLHGWNVKGNGDVLDYYVPDLDRDIIAPLLRHGCHDEQIQRLCAFPKG